MTINEVKSQTVEDILKHAYDTVITANNSKVERAKTIVSKLVSTSEESSGMLINEMKSSDVMFKSIFDGVFFAGLLYDGIQDVNESYDFTLYFILNLPFGKELKHSDCHSDVSAILDITSGYSCLWSERPCSDLLSVTNPDYSFCGTLNKFFDYSYTGYFWRTYYYVMVSSRILHWFGNLLSTAIGNILVKQNSTFSRWFYNNENLFYDIGIEELGPANLKYKYTSNLEIYLELCNKEGLHLNIQMQPVFNYQDKLLVPRPQEHNASLWRLSNIKSEKNIVQGKGCVEEVIRLLLKLCRMQGTSWEELTGYHIKTVVLLHLQNNPWLTNDLALLFMGSLRDLLECLARRKIVYYFDNNYNLLEDLDVYTMEIMKERLERILKDIHKNPTITLLKYFTVKECNTETVDGSDPSYCSMM